MRTEGKTNMNELEELRRRIAELEHSEADRKRAWEALQASEVWYRTFAENLPGIVYRVYIRESNRMQFFNNMLPTMTGYKVEELEGSRVCSFESLIVPEDRADVMATVKNAIIEDKPFEVEYRLKHKDGRIQYFFERGKPIRGTDGKPLHIDGVILDITERKRAEEAVRESEERHRTVLEALPDPVVVYDMEGKGTYINPAFTKVFGWTPEELLGKKLDYVPEENWPETQMMISKVLAGESFSGVESRRYTKEGDILDVSISTAVYLNADGIPVGSVHMLRDITDQKRAEERLKETMADLERSNAELQQFAYIASHDLQEPMRKIQAFGDRLKVRYAEALDERGCDYLDRMQNASRRMQALVNNLLTLSRITTRAQPFVPVNLADVVQEIMSDLELYIERAGGSVEVGNMPTIDADPTQMRQLLQNLIKNGLKFHRAEVKPVVKVYGQVLNEVCQLIVEDNGIGFEEKYLDRIFAVFQRLHGRGEYDGTGVGLAICQKIAGRHGGSITAKSTPGQGAKFIVTLPVRQPRRGEVNNE